MKKKITAIFLATVMCVMPGCVGASDGASASSANGDVETVGATEPGETSIESLTAKRKGFTVKYKTVTLADGYQINYSLKKDFTGAKTVTVKSNTQASKKISSLEGGRRYYVRVRTYRKDGGENLYSDWSDTETVKTCKYLVAIDAGHQKTANLELEPIGPGASQKKYKVAGGTYGRASDLAEYQLTLKVSKKLKKELVSRGYEVKMIRTKHNVNIPNSTRAIKANNWKADAFIRLHADAADSSSASGAMTICQTSSNKWNKDLYSESYHFSKKVLKYYTKKTGIKSRGVWKTDSMSGINWCQVPVTILEMGFMTNTEEDLKMADSDFQKKMVVGMSNGIDNYFKWLEKQ